MNVPHWYLARQNSFRCVNEGFLRWLSNDDSDVIENNSIIRRPSPVTLASTRVEGRCAETTVTVLYLENNKRVTPPPPNDFPAELLRASGDITSNSFPLLAAFFVHLLPWEIALIPLVSKRFLVFCIPWKDRNTWKASGVIKVFPFSQSEDTKQIEE